MLIVQAYSLKVKLPLGVPCDVSLVQLRTTLKTLWLAAEVGFRVDGLYFAKLSEPLLTYV